MPKLAETRSQVVELHTDDGPLSFRVYHEGRLIATFHDQSDAERYRVQKCIQVNGPVHVTEVARPYSADDATTNRRRWKRRSGLDRRHVAKGGGE